MGTRKHGIQSSYFSEKFVEEDDLTSTDASLKPNYTNSRTHICGEYRKWPQVKQPPKIVSSLPSNRVKSRIVIGTWTSKKAVEIAKDLRKAKQIERRALMALCDLQTQKAYQIQMSKGKEILEEEDLASTDISLEPYYTNSRTHVRGEYRKWPKVKPPERFASNLSARRVKSRKSVGSARTFRRAAATTESDKDSDGAKQMEEPGIFVHYINMRNDSQAQLRSTLAPTPPPKAYEEFTQPHELKPKNETYRTESQILFPGLKTPPETPIALTSNPAYKILQSSLPLAMLMLASMYFILPWVGGWLLLAAVKVKTLKQVHGSMLIGGGIVFGVSNYIRLSLGIQGNKTDNVQELGTYLMISGLVNLPLAMFFYLTDFYSTEVVPMLAVINAVASILLILEIIVGFFHFKSMIETEFAEIEIAMDLDRENDEEDFEASTPSNVSSNDGTKEIYPSTSLTTKRSKNQLKYEDELLKLINAGTEEMFIPTEQFGSYQGRGTENNSSVTSGTDTISETSTPTKHTKMVSGRRKYSFSSFDEAYGAEKLKYDKVPSRKSSFSAPSTRNDKKQKPVPKRRTKF